MARKKFDVNEIKKQEEEDIKTKKHGVQEKEKQDYYKKRNTQKGRMLERKNGQPVMKHLIGNLLTKIKSRKET